VDDEIRLYLAHGILHLAGYDDTTARLRKKMCRLQEEILEK
jgi:rRNA maturation RNase YbeY